MPTPALLLVAGAALAADDRFYPGEGDTLVSYAAALGSGAVRGRTGRVLVRAEDADVVRTTPGVARADVLPGGLLRVTPRDGQDDLALARALHGRPGIRWAHPDMVVELVPAGVPDDPLLTDEWHLQNTGQGGRTPGVDVDAFGAWEIATGAGVTIAVIDSGVQPDHPDLRVIPGHDYVGRDDDPTPDDSDSAPHGTAVAGVAAAVGDDAYGVAGVAWNADVYAIRLIGGETSLEDLYTAFVEAVDAGAGVLSNSWGFSDGCEQVTNYSVFGDMFGYAEDQGRGGLGSVVVFAAGNGGCDVEDDGMLQHKKIVVVAAIEADDSRAWYSSYGDAVDLAAPTSLLTTDLVGGGYGSYGGDDAFADGFSGTSASTPVVSGVVALLLEANPRLTAAQIRDVLCATAVRNDVEDAGYDADGRSPYYGCGRVDAGAAVRAVADTAPEAPVPVAATTSWAGRVRLAWEPAADPDGDVVGYEVGWWREGEDPEAAPLRSVSETSLDLSEEVVAGDTLAWRVRAVDPWGAGPWSEVQGRLVEALPEPPTRTESPAPPAEGCVATPGHPGVLAVALGLAAVRRRRPAR